MHVGMHVFMYVCMYVSMHACAYAGRYICMHVCADVCRCVCVCMCVCIYTICIVTSCWESWVPERLIGTTWGFRVDGSGAYNLTSVFGKITGVELP